MKDKKCGTCKYYAYWEDGELYCSFHDNHYGDAMDWQETCENWEKKGEGENE